MLKPNARDGVYLEVSVDPGITRPGTADIVMINGTSGVLVDYKFTRVEREHDAQMKSYVVGVFRTIERLQALEVRNCRPAIRDDTSAGHVLPQGYTGGRKGTARDRR